MTDKTYTLELTEKDIKDLASTRASRKVWRDSKYYVLAIAFLMSIAITISFVFDFTFTPIGGTFIVLVMVFYVWIFLAQAKYTKTIIKELTNGL